MDAGCAGRHRKGGVYGNSAGLQPLWSLAVPGVFGGFRYRRVMAQITVYGKTDSIRARRKALSDAIHGAVMVALEYPPEKKFHRFIGLDDDSFIYPDDRGRDYTIVEVSLFEGRSVEAKRRLIRELFDRIETEVGVAPHSLEITIHETPRVNWGIRGSNAEDLALGYEVEV